MLDIKSKGLALLVLEFKHPGCQEIEDHGDDDHDHGDSDWYTNPSDGVSFGASFDLSRCWNKSKRRLLMLPRATLAQIL